MKSSLRDSWLNFEGSGFVLYAAAIVVFDKNVQLGIVKCVIKVIKCVVMLIGVVNLEQIKATRVRSTTLKTL